jgi:acyl-CoA thioesterase-1
MRIPPNYGKQYTEMFAAVYPKVAALTQAPLVPFFLDRVAGHPDLMQVDGIHPNEKAQPILMNAALKGLEPLLRTKTKAGHASSPRKSGGR